jgi:Fasciclin domain
MNTNRNPRLVTFAGWFAVALAPGVGLSGCSDDDAGGAAPKDIVATASAATLQGGSVAITVSGSTVKVNDATVTTADVGASNGVIHVIDTVLLPPSS